MLAITHFATALIWLMMGALAAIVAFGLLAGSINTRYLFYGQRKNGQRYFSPERVQLLLITLWVALNYLLNVVNSPHTQSLPDVDQNTLALLGGSQLLYLGGKAYSRFAPKFS